MRKRTKIAISSSSNEPIADVEMTDPNVMAAVNIGLSSPVMLLAPAPAGAEPLDADAVAAIAGTNNSGSSKGKGRAMVVDDSDDEVIYGLPKRKPAAAAQGEGEEKADLMSRFLPSTKMKYMMEALGE